MDKRTLNIIYWVAMIIEFLCCYKWLLKPVGPVFLSLLKGTYEFDITNNFLELTNSLVKITIQVIAFSFLFIGTTKLYKHFYVSLPSNNSGSSDNKR